MSAKRPEQPLSRSRLSVASRPSAQPRRNQSATPRASGIANRYALSSQNSASLRESDCERLSAIARKMRFTSRSPNESSISSASTRSAKRSSPVRSSAGAACTASPFEPADGQDHETTPPLPVQLLEGRRAVRGDAVAHQEHAQRSFGGLGDRFDELGSRCKGLAVGRHQIGCKRSEVWLEHGGIVGHRHQHVGGPCHDDERSGRSRPGVHEVA